MSKFTRYSAVAILLLSLSGAASGAAVTGKARKADLRPAEDGAASAQDEDGQSGLQELAKKKKKKKKKKKSSAS